MYMYIHIYIYEYVDMYIYIYLCVYTQTYFFLYMNNDKCILFMYIWITFIHVQRMERNLFLIFWCCGQDTKIEIKKLHV